MSARKKSPARAGARGRAASRPARAAKGRGDAARSKGSASSSRSRAPRVDRARVQQVVARLARHDPSPRCALEHANAYELLAATILSAQCTDVRVNMVTPALFARYPTPADLASAEQEDVEELVRSTGFYRNKARNLVAMAQRLVEHFGGEVPQEMDALLTLPGVARKTANVVRGEIWGLADGVVVDTHVQRLSIRLGLTRQSDPVRIERDLMELIPRDHWIAFSHRLIRLGRTICVARSPRCHECPLAEVCPKVGVSAPGRAPP